MGRTFGAGLAAGVIGGIVGSVLWNAILVSPPLPETEDRARGAAGPGTEQLEERLRLLEESVARLARESLENPGRAEDAVRAGAARETLDGTTLDALSERIARLEERLGGEDPAQAERDRLAVRALNAAIARGDAAEIQRLLALGLDLDARDDDGVTALAAAAVAGDVELLDMLLAAGADLERKSGRRRMTPLLAALDAGQEEAALALIQRGCDFGAVDKNGENSLIWAAFNGCEEVVERLVELGLDTDFRSHDGATPLLDAARRGHLEVVRLLLEAGADPNLADGEGQTPLARALAEGNDEVAALLRSWGAE